MVKSKVGDPSQGRPEGSLFNNYYTEGWGRSLHPYPDYSTLLLIRALYSLVLTFRLTQVSRTIGEHSTNKANEPK